MAVFDWCSASMTHCLMRSTHEGFDIVLIARGRDRWENAAIIVTSNVTRQWMQSRLSSPRRTLTRGGTNSTKDEGPIAAQVLRWLNARLSTKYSTMWRICTYLTFFYSRYDRPLTCNISFCLPAACTHSMLRWKKKSRKYWLMTSPAPGRHIRPYLNPIWNWVIKKNSKVIILVWGIIFLHVCTFIILYLKVRY